MRGSATSHACWCSCTWTRPHPRFALPENRRRCIRRRVFVIRFGRWGTRVQYRTGRTEDGRRGPAPHVETRHGAQGGNVCALINAAAHHPRIAERTYVTGGAAPGSGRARCTPRPSPSRNAAGSGTRQPPPQACIARTPSGLHFPGGHAPGVRSPSGERTRLEITVVASARRT